MNRMFPFVTRTWNPVGGKCPHGCIYCWATALIIRYKHKKYLGESYRDYRSKEDFKEGDFVFVCDMIDLFAETIPNELIYQVFSIINQYPKTTFLLLTKNPKRYLDFINHFPPNVILGATIESNLNYSEISHAPTQETRLIAMFDLKCNTTLPLFICAEPILDFTKVFFTNLMSLKPWAIAIGYDNYNHELPEPILRKTNQLIEDLEREGIKVYRKTLRKAWFEDINGWCS